MLIRARDRKKPSSPLVERLNNGQPIVQRILANAWENKVTLNPACVLVTDRHELSKIIEILPFNEATKTSLRSHDALCFLLYRAQGRATPEYDHTRSSLGLAILSPGLRLLARHDQPVMLPDRPYDNLGVEDPRITRVGSTYVMFYTAYGRNSPENRIRIAIATSVDFIHWEKHGLLKGEINTLQNKNAMLFEQKAGGKHVMLHRPMEGENAMAIHWAVADEIFGEWTTRGVLIDPVPRPGFIDAWIGGGAPPLHLSDEKYLLLYHTGNRKSDGKREYDLGIAVVDFTSNPTVLKRLEPLLRPETQSETTGDADLGVNDVVFICGAYFYRGDLYFPYAGADSVVLGGKISKEELDTYLSN
jgi:predicted GH43/DUF377 family glycosyl hydrolase